VFEIVVVMMVQSVFHLEIHQNKIILFFKNYFLTLLYQNKFKRTQCKPRSRTHP